MKRCISCGQRKEREAFGRNRALPDGRSVYCLECNRIRNRAYYAAKRQRTGHMLREPDRSPDGFKRCSSCRHILPVTDFHAHKTQFDGLNTYCKACRKAQNRATHLRRTYGLTEVDLAELIATQGGVCAMCKVRQAEHVDHDHAFGHVRGVLCFPCNASLGHLQDSTQLFRNGIDYLERTTWQRTLVSTGVYQLTSPRRAQARSATSFEQLRLSF